MFTKEETIEIKTAAQRTEQTISSDIEQVLQPGDKYDDVIVEMILDANRIETIGGLSSELYQKITENFKEADKIVRKRFQRS